MPIRLACVAAIAAVCGLLPGCSSAPPPKAIVFEPFDPPVKAVHIVSAEYVPDQRHGAGLSQGGHDHVLQRRVARPVKGPSDDRDGR